MRPAGAAPPLRRHRDALACPTRYRPVSDAGFAMISAGVPDRDDRAAVHARRRGPCRSRGRRRGSCRGRARRRRTVLPRSRRRVERREQARVVALVEPDRRLVEDVEHARSGREPICVARRMRWPSPPDSVAAPRGRASGSRARRRAGSRAAPRISFRMGRAISVSCGPSVEAVEEARRASPIDSADTSTMLRPPTRTKRASRRSRVPSQSVQRRSLDRGPRARRGATASRVSR